MEQSIKTIRVLKITLPILFISFVLLIVVFYTGRTQPARDGPAFADRPERNGEQPRLISYEFEDIQTVGDRVISRIRAARTVGFDSGWYTLDRIELDVFREDGSVYTMTAPIAEFNAETKEAQAAGGVIVTSADGLDLQTESITFDGSSLTNRVPVRFRMKQWSGTARGADLDVENETVTLNEGVDVSFSGEGPESVDLTADTATFERMNGTAVFEGDVTLVRSGDTYESERIMTQLDQKRERLIALEGTGNVVIRIAPDSRLSGSDPPGVEGGKRISASRFVGKFNGRGEMNAVELFGETGPVQVDLHGVIPRAVTANSARVRMRSGGAESLELYGNVQLVEEGELERSIRAERLVVTVDAQSGRATSALFDGDVRYRDAKNQARSERIFYDLREETIRLSSVPGSAPTISSGPQRVSADEIIVEPESGAMRARGQVITRIVNTAGVEATAETALFPASEAIFINSETLAIREENGFAAFGGNVRAWQGNNTLFADELQIRSGGEAIDAKGNVRTILQNSGEGVSGPVKSRSHRLEARRAENLIELIEDVMIESEGRSLEADRARFVFGGDQELERVIATGELVLKEAAAGRSGTGEKAVYEIADETILIEGSPAEIREPRGTVRGQQIVLDLKRNRVDVIRGDSPTEATYNAEPGVR